MSRSAPNFEGYYASLKNRILFRWVDFQKKRLLRRALGSRVGLRILDLGCGSAGVSAVLVGKNEIWGVDGNEGLLEVARSRGLKCVKGDLDDIPSDLGTFDAIVTIDSIEHVESRKSFQEVLRRLAKPGATIVIITPNYRSILWNIGETFTRLVSGMKACGHISPFTPESLGHFLKGISPRSKTGKLNFGMWLWAIAELP